MGTGISQSRVFTKEQVNNLLTAAVGKTLMQVDSAELFRTPRRS